MAIYRTIQISFWTDEKVLDDFTPEDKYFYLYLFTNPQTNLCGCYQLGWTSTTSQLGYNKDTVLRLLDRFENVHHLLQYSKDTKEVFLFNWHKYNWQGGNQLPCLEKEIDNIKDNEFRSIVRGLYASKFGIEGAYKGLDSPHQATVTVTVNNTVTDTVIDIVNYLNIVCNTNYKSNTKNTVKHIKARLNDGYTVDDFKTVIDKKAAEWTGTSLEQYLRPDTLFGTKFESYLNQNIIKQNDKIANRVSVVDEWV